MGIFAGRLFVAQLHARFSSAISRSRESSRRRRKNLRCAAQSLSHVDRTWNFCRAPDLCCIYVGGTAYCTTVRQRRSVLAAAARPAARIMEYRVASLLYEHVETAAV